MAEILENHIAAPLLPLTFFVFVMKIIGVFNIFEQPFIMTNGGPSGSLKPLSITSTAMHFNGLIWAMLLLWPGAVYNRFAVTYIQFKYQGRWVHYE